MTYTLIGEPCIIQGCTNMIPRLSKGRPATRCEEHAHTCKIPNCESKTTQGPICAKHIQRMQRWGSYDLPTKSARQITVENAIAFLEANGYVVGKVGRLAGTQPVVEEPKELSKEELRMESDRKRYTPQEFEFFYPEGVPGFIPETEAINEFYTNLIAAPVSPW